MSDDERSPDREAGEDGRTYPVEVVIDDALPGTVSFHVDSALVAELAPRVHIERNGVPLAVEERSRVSVPAAVGQRFVVPPMGPELDSLPSGVYSARVFATLTPRKSSGTELTVSGTAYFEILGESVLAISLGEYSRAVLPLPVAALDEAGNSITTIPIEQVPTNRRTEAELLGLAAEGKLEMDRPPTVPVESSLKWPAPEAATHVGSEAR